MEKKKEKKKKFFSHSHLGVLILVEMEGQGGALGLNGPSDKDFSGANVKQKVMRYFLECLANHRQDCYESNKVTNEAFFSVSKDLKIMNTMDNITPPDHNLSVALFVPAYMSPFRGG